MAEDNEVETFFQWLKNQSGKRVFIYIFGGFVILSILNIEHFKIPSNYPVTKTILLVTLFLLGTIFSGLILAYERYNIEKKILKRERAGKIQTKRSLKDIILLIFTALVIFITVIFIAVT